MKFRKTLKITSRTSSVTNGFVQAIIPCLEPTDAERTEAFLVLGIDSGNPTCVYCGSPATDWDHLRPLVKGKRPTGYFTGIQNLAKGSPKSRRIAGFASRIAALESFEAWSRHDPIEMREIVGSETWDSYWARLETIERQMHDAQREAVVIRAKIADALTK